MPLLGRLLGRRSGARRPPPAPHKPPPHFSKEQVRVLLFRESERSGTRLLFDSSSVRQLSAGENKDAPRNLGYEYLSPNADSMVLGEMIFGSVAMNFRGISLKMHLLDSPRRLMCIKVFCPSGRRRYRTSTTSGHGDSVSHSMSQIHNPLLNSNHHDDAENKICNSTSGRFVSSLDIPHSENERHFSLNWPLSKDDSGFCGDFSSQSSIGSSSNYDSNNSFREKDDTTEKGENIFYYGYSCKSRVQNNEQWRLNRHLSTNFGYSTASSRNSNSEYSMIPNINEPSNSRTSTTESISGNSSCSRSSHCRSAKIGLAILITLTDNFETQMLRFLTEHAVFIEAALDRIRYSLQNTSNDPQSLISKMYLASDETAQWFIDLITGPKLSLPLWISLAESQNVQEHNLRENFLHDFSYLLNRFDTKETYFFLSTLITNVLTYHLGWVNTVSPYYKIVNSQRELDALNCNYPYNPLWAQLGELCGAIGTPARTSKTIVHSKNNSQLVEKIVSVLSYFIRCGKVKRFNASSNCVQWESFESLTENHKCDDSARFNYNNVSQHTSNSNFDYIEMRTFSSNSTLVNVKDENSITQFSSSNGIELNSSNFDNGRKVSKSTLSLKRTKSYSTKLKSVSLSGLSNEPENHLLVANTNHLNSTSTLVPSQSEFVDPISEVTNNLCELYSESNIENGSASFSTLGKAVKVEVVNQVYNDKSTRNKNVDISLNVDKNHIVEGLVLKKEQHSSKQDDVVFVLGENEALVGIRDKISNECVKNCLTGKNESSDIAAGPFSDSPNLSKEQTCENLSNWTPLKNGYVSCSADSCCIKKSSCKHSKSTKHSGVKFEFEKYPKIVTNYMKSKNLELLDRHVIGKPGNLKIDGFEIESVSSVATHSDSNEKCTNCSLNNQILQTPSNASELEFTSDIPSSQSDVQYAQEKIVLPAIIEPVNERVDPSPKIFIRKKLENTLLVNNSSKTDMSYTVNLNAKSCNAGIEGNGLNVLELPLSSVEVNEESTLCNHGYCNTLMRGISDHYVSDMILQGMVNEVGDWEHQVRRDLLLQSRNAPGGAACLMADIDDWNVTVWGSGCGAVGMSTLIASMLDTLCHMFKAKVPATQCLSFIECRLRELCVRSKVMAEMLLNTDLCDMNYLTKCLNLEANDVPLLLAIASTHSPQVAMKYGISFR